MTSINLSFFIIIIVLIFFFFNLAELHSVRGMAVSECSNVVFEGPLVLEIRAANAEPELPAVLLVCPPVTSYCKWLPTFPAPERLRAVLALVMCLQGSEVLQWP